MSSVPPPAPSPEAIRAATRAVLDRPEFAEPPQWHQTLADILLAIKEWLDRVAGWSEANPTLARIVFIIALIVLLACLAHVLYLALADTLPFRRRSENKESGKARWEILEGAAANWQEALHLARAKLAEGDLKRAVWIVHRVFLGLLDQQGAIQFAGWKTNSHYLRECAPAHPWRKSFAELSELYEEVIYASRPVTAADVAASVAEADRLYAEAGAR